MIIVLTGPVHSGKTTLLREIVVRLKKRNLGLDGYLSWAVVRDGQNIGYDLFDLASEKAIPLLRKEGKKGWTRVGPYFFVPEALKKAKQKIIDCSRHDFLVVDEIGPLEVRRRGVWPTLSAKLKNRGGGCAMVVRRSILHDLLRRFVDQSRIEIIDVDNRRASLLIQEKIIAWSKKTKFFI